MPKRLRDYPIYLAPKIKGFRRRDGVPIIVDEKTRDHLDPHNIDDKIKIYERQVQAWFLDRASGLLRGGDNGFIILMIGTSYIEGVQQYINGEASDGRSRKTFRQGLRRIFPSDVADRRLDDFYVQVRCGLFHNGMSGSQVVISSEYEQPINFSGDDTGDIIEINHKMFLSEIRKDFKRYISILNNEANADARANFDRMFSVV